MTVAPSSHTRRLGRASRGDRLRVVNPAQSLSALLLHLEVAETAVAGLVDRALAGTEPDLGGVAALLLEGAERGPLEPGAGVALREAAPEVLATALQDLVDTDLDDAGP